MTYLILGLVIFFGIHSISIAAPATRDRLVADLGAMGWRAVYSLISVAGFVLLIHGYGLMRQAPVLLYVPPSWLRHVTFVLMLPVFPCLFAAYLPGRIKTKMKNPMLVAVKTWALAHLLANGALADVLVFGSFLLWAAADRISLKYRVARPIAGAPPSPWNDVIAVVGGLAVYAAMVFGLHRMVIGVPIM
jgi:uncharacterized membrane protein